ncbi:MAG: type II toxin-antitoxin system Phd/YefM family antitoxin [Corynebacterium sp.]|uniref:type II toxin-antitoxin system Phd/YefM family antitoxin n=1 Tax=Corynebacterium sp. TaxID=1720 RepID=UPI0026E09854|nr:type II toxin-antitoxin system Phd/YefM family antitoxin [Corynebacterium sp.]MDO5668603.1 type II toxin-antitoxin system Phd/YefM family antitoxin [Corynebacterium sp.]
MAIVSSRDFNRDVSAAKRAAARGPVIVTDRGEPAFVLLSIADYRRLSDSEGTRSEDFLRRLQMEDDIDVEFPAVDLDMKVPDL